MIHIVFWNSEQTIPLFFIVHRSFDSLEKYDVFNIFYTMYYYLENILIV